LKKYQVEGFAFIGRTFDEYIRMFSLTDSELESYSFLDCPGGACSFTAEAQKQGINATATDIEYGNSLSEFKLKCEQEVAKVKIAFSKAKDLCDWSFYGDLDHLLTYRKKAAKLFLEDYHENSHHYTSGKIPILNHPDNKFDIVLSGHFLFLYSDRLDFDFHLKAILELLRVARNEVRIYPLLGLDGSPYIHMNDLLKELSQRGYLAEIHKIEFEFLKGSNQLLSIRKSQ